MNDYKERYICRACDNTNLVPYLTLGEMPLVNQFSKEPSTIPTYPLRVNYCQDCSLSQLSIVVDPKLMFSHYTYSSSISGTFRKHCQELANDVKTRVHSNPKAIDIASNDGCMLEAYKNAGFSYLGIDPAENIVAKANEKGLTTWPLFWNETTAKKVVAEWGKSDVISAQNVFAHIDDMQGFVRGVNTALNDDGVFIIEAPHVLEYLNHTEFDTTYHEHLSYVSLKAIDTVLRRYGMETFDVKSIPIHGGTIRVYAGHSGKHQINDSVKQMFRKEYDNGLYTLDRYLSFNNEVQNCITSNRGVLEELAKNNVRVAAFGASAKGTILLNSIGPIAQSLEYIVDETPEKKDQILPNLNIPVVGMDTLRNNPPEVLLITPWNFTKEIIDKTKDLGLQYLVPIPIPKIIMPY